jgi:hypothetical protein
MDSSRGYEFHHIPRANNDEADQLSKIGSTRQAIPSGVSLEIIRKPSIRPSPESNSIYVPEDPAPAKARLPNLGAAVLEQEGAAGPSSEAGSTKSLGAAVSKQTPPAGQLDEAGPSVDPGAIDPLVASVFTSKRYHLGQNRSPTTSSLGTCQQVKRKLGDFSAAQEPTPLSTASRTSTACQGSTRSALRWKKGESC